MGKSAHLDTFVRDRLPPIEAQPHFLFERPEFVFPDRLNAGALLDGPRQRAVADKPAVVCGDRALTYDALRALADRIARVLVEDMGLVPGNRVLLHAPNRIETVAAWFGVLRAGGVVVTTMPMLRAGELVAVVDKAQISHAIVDVALLPAVEMTRTAAPCLSRVTAFGPGGDLDMRVNAKPAGFRVVDTAADDAAMIAFTSGTTGTPKGCVQFHRDITAIVDGFCRHVLDPDADEVFCGTPPFAFTFGLGGSVIFPLATGATTILPERAGYDGLTETIARHGVTTLFTAPTAYRALLKGDLDALGSLRKCVSAGEALSAATSDAWFTATGLRLIDGIGATEMMHIFISASGDDIRPGATGRPVPGYVACTLDAQDRPQPPGSIGRLAVRGPTGCRYLDDPRQATYVVHGWNVTGDLYHHRDDGWFAFVSRADDMIVSSGYNIGAPEVEAALLLHPSVAEAAVIGAPDPERGQICKAFVVLNPLHEAGPTLVRTLQDHVKATIAPYKYPRAIAFIDALPKTETGKLQRFKLKAPEWAT